MAIDSSDPVNIGKIVMFLIIYVFGTIGNFMVIFMIIYLGQTRKITHWYVLQLAVADILFLQSLPFAVMEVLEGRWIHPPWVCALKQTVLFANFYGTIIFLSIMALDRYIAVCQGLSRLAEKLRSLGTCYVITVISWLVALLLCVPVMMYGDLNGECKCSLNFPPDQSVWCKSYNYSMPSEDCNVDFGEFLLTIQCNYQDKITENELSENALYDGSSDFSYYDAAEAATDAGPGQSDSGEAFLCFSLNYYPGFTAFVYFNFSVMFIIPVIIISVCYGLIVVRLRKTGAKVRRHSEGTDSSYHSCSENARIGKGRISRRKSSSSGRCNRHKLKVTVMCGMLVVLFVVCWLPFHALHLAKLDGFYTSQESCEIAGLIAVLLIYANSALNPYLYNFLGTFGKRMREMRSHRRTTNFMATFRATTGRFVHRRSSDASKPGNTIIGTLLTSQDGSGKKKTTASSSSNH